MKNKFSKWDVGGGSRSIIQGLNLFTSRNLFKSLKSILMVVALLSLSSNVWGADVTAQWTAASGDLGSGIGSGTITDNKGNSWSYTRTLKSGASYTGWTSNCIQLGKNGGVENLTISTSAITGTIKSVQVECSSYNNAHKVAISVGSTSYLSATATAKWTTVSSLGKSSGGTSSGTITISVTDGTRAFYIKSITVTYEEAASDTWKLMGLGDWSTGLTFDANGECTKNLSANTTYTGDGTGFKIVKNSSTWYGNNGTMNSGNCTNWEFTTSGGNASITTTRAGEYKFKMSVNGSGNPVLSVTYPPDTWQLAGFNDWSHPIDFVNGSCQVTLTAKEYATNTNDGFKLIKNGDTWYGNNGTMTRANCSGWTFESEKNNCGIVADEAGTYTFTINTSGANPVLSVTYPVASLKSIAEVIDATTSTEKALTVTMNNWVITAVSGNQAYITDGTNAMLLYSSGHGFSVGDHLTGTVSVKTKIYNDLPEFTTLTSSTANLTKTPGTATPVAVTDLSVLDADYNGFYITFTAPYITDGEYDYFQIGDDGDNWISYWDKWNTGATVTVGNEYNVTGIVIIEVDGDEYSRNVAPLTNSAIQEVVHTYDATFANGGHGTAPAAQSAVSSVTLAAITGVTGWTNDYWTTNVAVKDGSNNTLAAGTHLNNATTYKLTANTTFTAHWQVNSHTLTWNFDGGSTTSGSSDYTHGTVNYGATITAPADPTKANKKFAGWMQNSVVVTPATTMPDNNLTYVAKWVDITWTDYLTDCSAPYTWTIWYQDPSDSQWKDAAITEGQAQFTLAKESTFNFKLRKTNVDDPRDPEDYTYYGASVSDNTYTTSGTPWTLDHLNSAGYDVHVHAGAAGTYTINVTNMTGDAPQISVTYPTAYTITFDGNDADDGSMTDVTNIAAGENVALPTPTFTKEELNCIGWTADVDVTVNSATITAGNFIPYTATIQNINSNITLTAVWEQLIIGQANDIHEVTIGGTLQLTLTANYSFNITTGATYTWATNDTRYATVDNNGLVTGHQAVSSGEYVTVTSNFGTVSNQYNIEVISAACTGWGLHYWNGEPGQIGDKCFDVQIGEHEYRTTEFVLPSASVSERVQVLKNGEGQTYTQDWAANQIPMIGQQSKGCGWYQGDNKREYYAGQDAVGYLRIYDNSTDGNYYLAFQPTYVFVYGENITNASKENQIEFHYTGKVGTEYADYETDFVQLPADYATNANQKFYVGTKRTPSSSQSPFIWDGKSAVTSIKDMRNSSMDQTLGGKWGVYQMFDNSCDANFWVGFIRYYRLNYNLNGGAGTGDYSDQFVLPSASQADRTFILETAPTKDGFTFRGWSVSIGGGAATTKQPGESVVLTEDAVVTAIWAQNYTVTYDLAGYSTSCSSSTVHYCGEEVTVCDDPEDKTGYTFMGWNTDDITGSPADFDPGYVFIMPCHDVVFTAHYQANEYTITYLDQNGDAFSGTHGTDHPTTHTYGTATTLVYPTKTGYNFGGWYLDDACAGAQITILAADGYTANITLYAKWTIQTYTVTFDLNGGQGSEPPALTDVPYNTTISAPDAPADYEDGSGLHTFAGWYKENTCDNAWDFASDVVTGNTTLYAKWSGVTYEDYRTHCCTPLDAPTGGVANDVHMTTATLNWNAVTNNNGYQVSADQTSWTNVPSGTTSYGLTDLTAGTPYIYYVRAIGDNDEYCQYGTTAQIEFTTKAALHITYNAHGGTGDDVVSGDIEEGTSATVADNTFTAPTGMTFNGWNTATDGTGTAYAVGATINPLNADLTLYAQWIGAEYNVTYDLAGGTGGCTSTTATYNSEFTICSTIPTKGTDAFTGWLRSDNSETYQAGETFTMPASDVTLTAQWTASYTVTYVINNVQVSGTSPAGNVYVAQGQSTTLPDFTFSCGLYDQFIGWVDATVAERDEKIACPTLVGKAGDSFTPTGNITLYALFGHDAENLGWVKQTTISSGKYIMATGTTVMTGFDAAQTSSVNNGSCTSVNESSTGVYNPTDVESAIQVQPILGTGGNAGKFALQYGDYYIVPSGDYLNYNVTDVTNAYTWKLTDGSQVSEKDCAAGVLQNAGNTIYICQKNSSQAKYKMYKNTQGATNCVYLYKLINEGYYTTSPTCEIPTSVTVTYNKNTEDEVTICENAVLQFTTYPTLTEAYTLCAAADVVREGYVLRTWNTAGNGTGKDYAPGTVFTELGGNLNLYAQWDRVYTVTLHDNGATSTKTQASEGAAIDLGTGKDAGDCDLDNDGTPDFTWKFEGWTTNNMTLVEYPVCPEVVANPSEYVPEANIDLYAVYSRPIENTTDFAAGVSGAYIVKDYNDAQYLGAKTSGDVFAFNAVAQSNAIVIKLVENNGSYNVATDAGFVEWDNSTSMRYEQLMNGHWTISGSAGNWSMQESAGSRYLCWNTTNRFNLQQSKRTVDLIPTTGTYYFSNPVCQDKFDITFDVRGGEINYGEALEEDYKDLASGAIIADFPTIDMRDDLMDWTFVGWTTVDYNTQHELDDENASTEAPTSTIYRTGGTNTFTMPSTNVTLYPVFTSAIANEPMDLENGGNYYVYFTSDKQGFHDPYTEIDGQTIRIYAQQVAGNEAIAAFASTTSCANAQLFHFEQREAGKWDIRLWNNAGDDYITNSYLTNPGVSNNDFASQAAQPEGYWTIEQLSDGSFKAQYSVNAGSKYFMKGLVSNPKTQASATFKCYNQDCDNSTQYYAVYLGSCVERTFSADPMPQANIRLEGTVTVTSRTGVAVRATNFLTLKGIKLEAGQKVTISSTNTDIYFSDSKAVNMSKAAKPVNPLQITIPASGSINMPIYVHYQPTATIDGIESVTVTANYNETDLTSDVKIRVRHLPEQVVIAAKIDNQWYALPANLNGATNPLVTPITVDETTMTAEAPTNCAYTLWPVKTTNMSGDRYQEVGERVRFSATNNGNKGLWASDAVDAHTTINNYAAITGIAADPAAPNYEWEISTNDLQVYTLTATGVNNTSNLSVARPTSGSNQGQLVWGTYGTNVTAEVYLLPFITFTDMQATVVEWFQDKVLVELANGDLWTAMNTASAQTQSRIGSAEWATAAAVDYTTYGTNMCTFNTGTLTSSYGQNLSVKTVIEETTYQTTLVVPIIIGNNKSVTVAPFTTITPAKYNTMDVVVRDGAVLTLNGKSDEQTTFNTITIEPSSKVVVNEGRNLGASLITLRGGYDEIYSGGSYTMGYDEPQLYIGGTSSATQINYEKRVDLDQMHGMSVPFEVEQTAITYLNGTSVKAGGNLYIDAYDGEKRAQYSGTKSSWYYYDETENPLYRGIGYTISAEPAVDGQNYTILRAPMATGWTKAVPGSESAAEVQVYAWGSESAIRDNHKGWNCLGNPYMANFGKADDATFGGKLYLGKLVETLDDKGNWTGGYHWDESTVRYVTIPHDDGHGFEQVRVQDAVLKPFRHFFVQVQTGGTLQFAKTDIQNSVVARATNDEPKEIELGILMSNGQATDNCGLLIGDDFSEGYEMMSDLGKELGQAMAIYTITDEYKLAFNAMNEDYAKGYIPVGYLAPKAGEYTISFDNDRYDIAPSVEHIYLLENGTPVADLKSVDYDFETTAGTNDDRFALSIVFNHNIGTDLSGADSMDEMPVKIVHNDKMYILMHGRVYSTTGKFIKTIKK